MRQIVANLYSDRIPTSSLATLLNNGSGVAALQNSCEEAAYSMEVMKSVATEAATVAMVLYWIMCMQGTTHSRKCVGLARETKLYNILALVLQIKLLPT